MPSASSIDLSYKKKPFNRDLSAIPGKYGLPVIGRTYKLLTDLHGLLDEHYHAYGSISRVRFIGHKTLLCLGPEVNKQIYLDTENNFSAEMGYRENLGEFYGGGLLMRDFADHKLHRRLFQTAFKTEAMSHYTAVINPVLEENLQRWSSMQDFHFFPHIKTTLLDIAAEVFLGMENIKGREAETMAQTFVDIAEGMLGIIRIDNPLLPFTKWRKGKQAKRHMENFLKAQIQQRRASDKQDIFSLFTRETDEDGNYFSDDDIAAHINFILFAAHDTTTSNLTYIMQYLGQHPQWQEKLRQECLSFNKSQLDYQDLSQLPLMDLVHLETLRLHPSVMMMNRRTIRDCELDGVKVPANTILSIAPQYSHFMEDYWDNPMAFDPDRFSPQRAEHKRHPFQFIPFGGGAHKCIGMHFAGMIVKTFLFQMLLRYEWQVAKDYTPKHQFFPMPKQLDDLPLKLVLR